MSRFLLPDAELTWRFSRSSGPGGQHVNTADTRVALTWSLRESMSLSAGQKARVEAALAHRLLDGRITIVSSQYRSQLRNRDAARQRLEELVTRALVPSNIRRPTRPTRASSRRRLEAKKRRSELKRNRGRPTTE